MNVISMNHVKHQHLLRYWTVYLMKNYVMKSEMCILDSVELDSVIDFWSLQPLYIGFLIWYSAREMKENNKMKFFLAVMIILKKWHVIKLHYYTNKWHLRTMKSNYVFVFSVFCQHLLEWRAPPGWLKYFKQIIGYFSYSTYS